MYSRKKIFDIVPPGKKKKEDTEEILSFGKREDVGNGGFPSFGKWFVVLSALLLLFLAGGYIFINPVAQIEIWPKKESLNLNDSLQASILAVKPDFSKKIIPAVPLEIEDIISQKFSSSVTTTKERAKGIIRVYNKYHLPVTLIKGTHFLASNSDVEFVSKRKITIPAKGHVDVGVIAVAAGEEYNIKPCAFSIPNLRKFSPSQLYYDVTGKSFSKMVGGRIAQISKVTKGDLDRAKKVLKIKAFKESEQEFKNKNSSSTIILERTINQDILSVSSSAKIGQETKNFVVQMKTKTRALGIKRGDINNFAKTAILSQVSSQKEIFDNTLNVDYEPKNIDLKNGTVTLNLSISADVYSHIDKNILKTEVKGELPRNAKWEIIKSFPNISKVNITIKPFWQRHLPKKVENIRIDIKP